MLAVAVRANWRVRVTLGYRFAMDTDFELLSYLSVAHPTGIRNILLEGRRCGPRNLMCGAVAYPAIRRAGVTLPDFLPVDAGRVLVGDGAVTGGANRLRNFVGVRVGIVLFMTCRAPHCGMRGSLHFVTLVVASETVRRRFCRHCRPGESQQTRRGKHG